MSVLIYEKRLVKIKYTGMRLEFAHLKVEIDSRTHVHVGHSHIIEGIHCLNGIYGFYGISYAGVITTIVATPPSLGLTELHRLHI